MDGIQKTNRDIGLTDQSFNFSEEEMKLLDFFIKNKSADFYYLKSKLDLPESKIKKALNLLIIKGIIIENMLNSTFCNTCPLKSICRASKRLNRSIVIYELNEKWMKNLKIKTSY